VEAFLALDVDVKGLLNGDVSVEAPVGARAPRAAGTSGIAWQL
jgi:hypothetical protein